MSHSRSRKPPSKAGRQKSEAAITSLAAILTCFIPALTSESIELAYTTPPMPAQIKAVIHIEHGSALASIGLTISTIAFVSIFFDLPLSLGVDSVGMTLLALTFFLSLLTIAIGSATVLHGVVHLVVFAAYLFLSLVP